MSRDDQFLSWLRDELSMLCADAETQVRSVQQGSSFAARSLHRAAHALQAALGQRGRDTMSLADVKACRRLDVTLRERDLVRDAGVTLPDSAVVFLMHQGYQFVYFDGGEGDDPHVHLFDEGESVRALGWTFSEWVLRAADDEIAGSRPPEA